MSTAPDFQQCRQLVTSIRPSSLRADAKVSSVPRRPDDRIRFARVPAVAAQSARARAMAECTLRAPCSRSMKAPTFPIRIAASAEPLV